MAKNEVTILDGSQLSHVDVSFPLPPPDTAITGAQVLDLAETRASLSLLGFVLPENLKNSALLRISVSDIAAFRSKTLDYMDACATLPSYISAIADELKDDPIAVTRLDGKPLNNMIKMEAPRVLDVMCVVATHADAGGELKTTTSELWNVVSHLRSKGMVPQVSEFPQLAEILDRYRANRTQEVTILEFAEVMVSMLKRIADSLEREPALVVLSNTKVANGSKIRTLLAKERLPDEIVEKITTDQYVSSSNLSCGSKVRIILEEYGDAFGLPSWTVPDMGVLLDETFTELAFRNGVVKSDPDTVMVILKEILENIAENLEANPIRYELHP